VRKAAKLLVKAGCAKGMLSGLLMHVKGPALLACVLGEVKLVDSGGDAMYLEDAGEY